MTRDDLQRLRALDIDFDSIGLDWDSDADLFKLDNVLAEEVKN